MKRRDVLSVVAAAAISRFAVAAQPELPIIGYLSGFSPESEEPRRSPFLLGLEKAGFIAGRNVAIEYRFAGGLVDQLPALAAELVRLPVTVLVVTGSQAAVEAKRATATIPIVFGVGADPVQLGLVASLSRPAGNATGVNAFSGDLGPKRLSLLRDTLPQLGLIAVLFGPSTASTPMQLRELEAAAQAIDQPILVLNAQNDEEVEKAFATSSLWGVKLFPDNSRQACRARRSIPHPRHLRMAGVRYGWRFDELQHEPLRSERDDRRVRRTDSEGR